MFVTRLAWSQIQGKREYQQDHAAVMTWPNGFRLLLLADGMGGHVGGDVASHMVIDVFKQHFIASDEDVMRDRLLSALEAANIAIFRHVKAHPEHSGMGTTLIALVYDGVSIQWLSIGDSPMWLLRDGEIRRLNANHSMSEILAQKVAEGEMTAEQARTSPVRSQLLEAVMGQNIEQVDAPDASMEMQAGDRLILASDGVETCSKEVILSLSGEYDKQPEDLVTAVLNEVTHIQRPGQDNATLIVLQIDEAVVDEPSTVQPENQQPVEEPDSRQ